MKPQLPFLLLLVFAAPALAQPAPPSTERVAAPEKAAAAIAPATLAVWNRPIAVFRVPAGQVSPAGRAARAAQRIEAMPSDVRPDEIRADAAAIGDLRGVLVSFRNQILFGILPEDLDPSAGETLESVSRHAVDQLRAVLAARADQRRLPNLIRAIGLSLGGTALLALVLWAVGRGADGALARMTRAVHPRAALLLGVDVWPLLYSVERSMVQLSAWGLGLVAIYLWLTFVLHQFPYTQPWGQRLGVYVVDFGLLQSLSFRDMSSSQRAGSLGVGHVLLFSCFWLMVNVWSHGKVSHRCQS